MLGLKGHYAAGECVGHKVEMIVGENEASKAASRIKQKEQLSPGKKQEASECFNSSGWSSRFV